MSSDSTVTQLELHSTKSQKASIIDTAVKNVFSPYLVSLYGDTDEQSFQVTQLWNPITLRNPKVGGDMFSETSVLTRAVIVCGCLKRGAEENIWTEEGWSDEAVEKTV
jgi:hypothetical protein